MKEDPLEDIIYEVHYVVKNFWIDMLVALFLGLMISLAAGSFDVVTEIPDGLVFVHCRYLECV